MVSRSLLLFHWAAFTREWYILGSLNEKYRPSTGFCGGIWQRYPSATHLLADMKQVQQPKPRHASKTPFETAATNAAFSKSPPPRHCAGSAKPCRQAPRRAALSAACVVSALPSRMGKLTNFSKENASKGPGHVKSRVSKAIQGVGSQAWDPKPPRLRGASLASREGCIEANPV